jgi:preprotein translocase subunit SecE
MGRIQRKKPSGSKKKKKQRSDSQRAVRLKEAPDSSVKKASSGQAVVSIAKKKPAVPQKRPPTAVSSAATKPKDNILTKTAQFLREVKVELKKVTWPSRKQTIGSTAVVIVLVMIISLFLGVVDFGISSLIRIVLQ